LFEKRLDRLGHLIQTGDWIAYAVRNGDTAGLNIGKVVNFMPTYFNVIGVKENYLGEVEVNKRLGRLEYGERVLVLRAEEVPPKLREKV
jgi:hypothetical protein